jgi:hypothetical protein
MPRHRTTAKGFPVDPKDCRAVRHLPGPEFKVYDIMMAFAVAGRTSHEGRDSTGPLLFTAAIKPTLCNALALSVNQTYLMRNRLEELGWIIKRADGVRRDDGKQSPDTWEVVSHGDFIKKHSYTCPNNPCPVDPEERNERRAMSAADYERLSRLVGKFNSPASRALVATMASFTEEDWQQVKEEWGFTQQEWLRLTTSRPVPIQRDQHKSLSVGNGASPYPEVPGQSLRNEDARPYETDEPVPMKRSDQSLSVGKNPLPTSANTTVTTTTTTTQTQETGKAVVCGGGCESASEGTPEKADIVESEEHVPQEPQWLKKLWAALDQDREDQKYGPLILRRPKAGDRGVSPDVRGIDKLIMKVCEKGMTWDRAEIDVRLAWAYFAFNPLPHCRPRNHVNPTLYPVTVFVANFDSYLDAGIAEAKLNRVAAYPPTWLKAFREAQ